MGAEIGPEDLPERLGELFAHGGSIGPGQRPPSLRAAARAGEGGGRRPRRSGQAALPEAPIAPYQPMLWWTQQSICSQPTRAR
jgi:hypothetical protein